MLYVLYIYPILMLILLYFTQQLKGAKIEQDD